MPTAVVEVAEIRRAAAVQLSCVAFLPPFAERQASRGKYHGQFDRCCARTHAKQHTLSVFSWGIASDTRAIQPKTEFTDTAAAIEAAGARSSKSRTILLEK